MMGDKSNFIVDKKGKDGFESESEEDAPAAIEDGQREQSKLDYFKPIEYEGDAQKMIQPVEKRKRGRPRVNHIKDLEKDLQTDGPMALNPSNLEVKVKEMRKKVYDGIMSLISHPLPPSRRPEYWKPLPHLRSEDDSFIPSVF